MNNKEKLSKLLEQEVEITPTPVEKINDNPEGRVEEVKPIDIFGDSQAPFEFETLVNPIIGTMKEDAILRIHKDFSERNKDTMIFNSPTADSFVSFYSLDRDEFVSYLAGLNEDDKATALKFFNGNVNRVYAREGAELLMDDYVNLAYNNVVSVNRDEGEAEVDGPSKDVPGNVMNVEEQGEE